jgi:hypothetical protein
LAEEIFVADADQPQHQSPQRAYVNFAAAQGSPIELAVTLGYREGDAEPTVVVPAVVAWEFVPVFIRLLQEQLDAYQEQVAPVRDVQQRQKAEEPT